MHVVHHLCVLVTLALPGEDRGSRSEAPWVVAVVVAVVVVVVGRGTSHSQSHSRENVSPSLFM